MTDVMRDMIAQLMGAQRAEEDGRKLPPYDDRSVCRAYLLDCCPREILADTRLENLIACRKLHEKALKADYLREQEKRNHFYEVDAFDALEECVKAVDYEIAKVKDKVKKDSEHLSDSQDYIKTSKIAELNDKINITLAQMEALGNEGKVHESVELSRTVSELQRKKQDMENELRSGQPVQQRLRVCESCGAQLNVLDHESRLADHYGVKEDPHLSGKMHLGMVSIREKYEEMKKTIDEKRTARRESGDRYYKPEREREKRRRSRSRDSRERRSKRSRTRSRSPRSSRSRKNRSRSRSPRSSRRRRD